MAKPLTKLYPSSVSRTDIYRIDPRELHFEQGFNLRDTERPEVQAHIQSIADTIKAGQPVPPITVYLDKDERIVVVDGHCRTLAAIKAIEQGCEPSFKLAATLFKGGEEERIALMMRANSGMKFTPLETAAGYLRLSQAGVINADIARMTGKTASHVGQYLLLATAPDEVKSAVAAGEMSAQTAIEMLQTHKGNATQVLRQAKQQSDGKRLTRKTLSQAFALPSRKRLPDLMQAIHQAVEQATVNDDTVTLPREVFDALREQLNLSNPPSEKE